MKRILKLIPFLSLFVSSVLSAGEAFTVCGESRSSKTMADISLADTKNDIENSFRSVGYVYYVDEFGTYKACQDIELLSHLN